ncbi:hypothetical protein ACHQM5_006061 [Ranunculus cassubicifolius]
MKMEKVSRKWAVFLLLVVIISGMSSMKVHVNADAPCDVGLQCQTGAADQCNFDCIGCTGRCVNGLCECAPDCCKAV